MAIDLKQFCSTDPGRPYLHEPCSRGDFTYATNGHIGVRVPRRDDVPENPKFPDLQRVMDLIPAREFVAAPPVKLPRLEITEEHCSLCDGRGTEHDCPDCECVCEDCNGEGVVTVSSDDGHYANIRHATFMLKYVRQILALPGIALPTVIPDHGPMPFHFDGGMGVLMPIMEGYGARAIVSVWAVEPATVVPS